MLTKFDLSCSFRIEIKNIFYLPRFQSKLQEIRPFFENMGSAVCLTEQAGRGWVSQIFVRRWRVLSFLSLICHSRIYVFVIKLAVLHAGLQSFTYCTECNSLKGLKKVHICVSSDYDVKQF